MLCSSGGGGLSEVVAIGLSFGAHFLAVLGRTAVWAGVFGCCCFFGEPRGVVSTGFLKEERKNYKYIKFKVILNRHSLLSAMVRSQHVHQIAGANQFSGVSVRIQSDCVRLQHDVSAVLWLLLCWNNTRRCRFGRHWRLVSVHGRGVDNRHGGWWLFGRF